jgi:3-hydroxyacyl-CoA dehydrogenase
LVEEIATDLRKQAIARARTLADAGTLPRVRDRAVPPCDRAAFDAAVAAVRRRARGALAPVRAAEAIGWALDLNFDAAAAKERAAALELRGGPQSLALRHLFHADRIAARMPEVDGRVAKTWPLKHAGVVGGGTMGSGIAISLADSGLDVTLIEVNEDAARAAEGRVRSVYDRHLKSGRIGKQVYDERLARIRYQTNLAQLAGADIVIEAVVEELPAKVKVFEKLSAVVRRDCVLASNTSALNVNLMADVVDAPERVLGMHFFSRR